MTGPQNEEIIERLRKATLTDLFAELVANAAEAAAITLGVVWREIADIKAAARFEFEETQGRLA